MFESLDFNTCVLLALGGTVYFCSKPKNERDEIIGNVLWSLTNKYHQFKIMMDDMFNNEIDIYEYIEDNEDDNEDDNTVEIITYNKSEENGLYIAELDEINITNLYDYKETNNLTFIKYIENNKLYLKRIEDMKEMENEEEEQEKDDEEEEKDDKEEEEEEEEDEIKYTLNITPVSKPFMQIDYEDDNNKIEIQGELEKYYVKDNKLLDKEFLRWYMKHYYQTDISEEYKIHILDENIKMFSLNNNQYIEITDDKDVNYKIINN